MDEIRQVSDMKKTPIGKNALYLIVALVAGVLLLLLSGSFDLLKSDETHEEEEDFELCEKRCEERIASLIKEVDGVESVTVLVTLDELPTQKTRPAVRGVAIVCHGRESAELKLKIVSLVRSALGVTSDKICVEFS